MTGLAMAIAIITVYLRRNYPRYHLKYDESAVPFCTSTAIGTALETITQSHEILYHSDSCDLLGWVVLMGMVLPELCLLF
jgi:hypothetical protein